MIADPNLCNNYFFWRNACDQVRLFLCSTFTDTAMERSALHQFVFPRLAAYCASRHGIQFQAVDMRTGLRDEVII